MSTAVNFVRMLRRPAVSETTGVKRHVAGTGRTDDLAVRWANPSLQSIQTQRIDVPNSEMHGKQASSSTINTVCKMRRAGNSMLSVIIPARVQLSTLSQGNRLCICVFVPVFTSALRSIAAL